MTDPSVAEVSLRRDGFGPAPDATALRERAGLVRVPTPFGPPAWLLTRHADVRAMLGDADAFANGWTPEDIGGARDPRQLSGDRRGNLLALDPPDHTRLRRMLTPEFTVRRMRRLEPRIVEIVDGHLDALERHGTPADLVARFALPVPSLVICELLGVPAADQDEFQQRTARQLDTTLPEPERVALAAEALAYMRDLVARARRDPGEDLIGMLIREHCSDDREEMSDAELVGVANLLLVAGHETTSNMLALGTLALLRHPDQLALVRDDPQAVPGAVEELLRWLSIVNSGSPRLALRDVEVDGITIRRGDLVSFQLPAANRDPAVTDGAERLDVARRATNHVAFGHGIHHCLGAPLARMEMRVAFGALVRRFPNLRLAVADDEVEWATHRAIHGLVRLPVTW